MIKKTATLMPALLVLCLGMLTAASVSAQAPIQGEAASVPGEAASGAKAVKDPAKTSPRKSGTAPKSATKKPQKASKPPSATTAKPAPVKPARKATPKAAPKKPVLGRRAAEARYQEGVAMEKRGDMQGASAAYHKAGESGYGPAQKKLGDLYGTGNDVVERDYETSLRWYDLARKQGIKVPKPITYPGVRR